jgi:dethiobiotin synthetase
MPPLFITGIGTDVGKTLVAAVVTQALGADYWKPVQAGFAGGTDAEWVRSMVSGPHTVIHDEVYRLHTPASPHIAARKDGIVIDGSLITEQARAIQARAGARPLVIEGAGGLLVPLNDTWFVADLIKPIGARVILVSRNYLGSINHSLLTAACCREKGLDVAGWIFNDDYLSYEHEIVSWSGYPSLGSIPKMEKIDREVIREQASRISDQLQAVLT